MDADKKEPATSSAVVLLALVNVPLVEAALETVSEEEETEDYEPGSWLDKALDREEREVEREALWN